MIGAVHVGRPVTDDATIAEVGRESLLTVALGARPAGRALEETGPEPGVALPPPAAVCTHYITLLQSVPDQGNL